MSTHSLSTYEYEHLFFSLTRSILHDVLFCDCLFRPRSTAHPLAYTASGAAYATAARHFLCGADEDERQERDNRRAFEQHVARMQAAGKGAGGGGGVEASAGNEMSASSF
jgi:hypothetical protein